MDLDRILDFIEWKRRAEGVSDSEIIEDVKKILSGRCKLILEHEFIFGEEGDIEKNYFEAEIEDYVDYGVESGNVNPVFGENLKILIDRETPVYQTNKYSLFDVEEGVSMGEIDCDENCCRGM
jgi:hypothetical protein